MPSVGDGNTSSKDRRDRSRRGRDDAPCMVAMLVKAKTWRFN
jgi:hypothetical protein